ncbi:Major Facilitator Superfamily protein [Microlunatus sagamiharensis]|uniref:Major Facilitator Superfamily protein n=1 Tax=Microlunatus sagamiharensis TaxID=546874 RepID=A0A1H2LND1_9ACTN|nr:MFS transporter [Microlunatus sagamiharensis]SDU82091.1 Major Facilitator Superfamily protein [Microlunatus sagamiharensis]
MSKQEALPVEQDQGSSPLPISQRALTVGICTITVSIAFESIAVATAMPVAAQDLGGIAYYAWAFSLFVIGMLLATVLAGRVCDRIGPSRPLLVGLGVFVVGLVVAGTAETMVQLVAGRFVQGLGGGVLNTAMFVTVAKAFRPAQRPKVFTFISTAWVLPSFVGPPVSAWLTSHLSWHWVFFTVIPLSVIGGAMVLPTVRAMIRIPMPEVGEDPTRQPPAPVWAAFATAVAAALLQAAGTRLDWSGLVLLVVALVLLGLGLPRLMPPGFLRLGRGLSSVILTRALLPGAYFGGEAFLPLMLVEQRDVPLLLAGGTLTVGAVGWTTGSFLQANRRLPLRRDQLITIGCANVAVGLALAGVLALVPTLPYWLIAVAWIFSGLGMGFATASTSLATITLSSEDAQGRNGSSLNLGDALGSSVFVGLAGTLFGALHPGGDLSLTFGVVLLSMSVVAVLSLLASLRVGHLSDPVH